MAVETEWSCPIYCNAEDDIAYVICCLHQFYLACILWCAKRGPSCPLCRQTVNTIMLPEGDFLEMDIPYPSDPLVDSH